MVELVTREVGDLSYMDVALVGLEICDSCNCKFKGFYVASSYKMKIREHLQRLQQFMH